MDQSVLVAIQRVLNQVTDLGFRVQLSEVIRLALAALDGLASLDDSLRGYFSDSVEGGSAEELAARETILREAYTKTFTPMGKLVNLITATTLLQTDEKPLSPSSSIPVPDESDLGDGWDFQLFPPAPPGRIVPRTTLPTLSDTDIEEAFGFVTMEGDLNAGESLIKYREEGSGLARVLCKEFQDADGRIQAGLAGKHLDAVLRELDTSRESLTEGLFVLLQMTFRHFLGEEGRPNRSAILPGYRDTLEKSLVIRRGLSDLRRVVTAENDWIIQDSSLPRSDRQEAIASVVESLKDFTESESFRFMRAPDRIELSRFLGTISAGGCQEASQACEGLSRYLESMTIINQREVLQQHDQYVMREIDGALDAARSVLSVSLSGARALVHQAVTQATRLYGKNTALDEQVTAWLDDPQEFDTAERLEKIISVLHEMLH